MNSLIIVDIIRPKSIFWFTICTCLGFSAVILQEIPEPNIVLLILSISLNNICAILINDIGDIKIDRLSGEAEKRSRPIASGRISIKEAWIIALIFFISSLFTAWLYSIQATAFSLIVFIFSLSYSLPPTRFCERKIWSILFWVILIIVCYLMMFFTLKGYLVFHLPSILFTIGTILFMGIGEIISIDLRDYKNDLEGGRKTFVGVVKNSQASTLMTVSTWFGGGFIVSSIVLSESISLLCYAYYLIVLFWCIYVTQIAKKISIHYDQTMAKSLHENWTWIYALMQIMVFLSFL